MANGGTGQVDLAPLAEEVRARADIVEIIGEYVALRPAGRSYKGLCPFHAERTPSFTVSPERQLYYCFGCGAGGNVYTFLMKHLGLSFPEALLRVAERAGMGAEVERALSRGTAPGPLQQAVRLREALQAAAEWFAHQLWQGSSGEAARGYLRRRRVSEATARAFGLGFAPDQWHALEQALRARGFPPALLEQAGLVVAREGPTGGTYDRFRGRLIFPVADGRGQVVGFGGRALQEGQEPKYLNSPETPLYQKGRLLYGLHLAREAIRRSGRAVVVEGYMDVLAMHQFGLAEAVATCGTSLTAEHGRLLARLAGAVVVAYDADAAGQAAALRGLKQLRAAGLDVRVAVLPEGHDPDSLLRQEGRAAMERVLASARGVYEFAVERALAGADLRSPEGKAQAAANIVSILAEVPGAVEQEALVQVVARRLGVSPRSLRRDVWRYQRRQGQVWTGQRGRSDGPGWPGRPGGLRGAGQAASGAAGTGYTQAGARARSPAQPAAPGASNLRRRGAAREGPGTPVERALVRLLLEVPELAGGLAGRVSAADFSDPQLGRLFEGLASQGQRALSDPELAAAAGVLLAGSELSCPPDQVEVYVQKLRELRAERELAELESNIEAVVAAGGDGAAALERLAELVVSYREVRERLRRGGRV